eukprot:14869024-Heterocapsa_arctica.AAC.1
MPVERTPVAPLHTRPEIVRRRYAPPLGGRARAVLRRIAGRRTGRPSSEVGEVFAVGILHAPREPFPVYLVRAVSPLPSRPLRDRPEAASTVRSRRWQRTTTPRWWLR